MHDHPSNQLLIVPSFVKAPNEWGYKGARYQGGARALLSMDAKSPEELLKASATRPFLMENGSHILPKVMREAASSAAERGESTMLTFRKMASKKSRGVAARASNNNGKVGS